MKAVWLARYLFPRLEAWSRSLPPTQIISDGTGANRPYLRRWKIIDSKWWHPGIYLHNMILNDDSSLHDHPYASVSLVVRGPITEHWQPIPGRDMPWETRVHNTGDIVYRSATMAHQLIVEPDQAWTLFIPFFRLEKGWGFYCATGYKPFEEYHATRRKAIAEGKSGSFIGCGE